MDTALTQEEVKGAYMWFFGVGALAVVVALTLYRVDVGLTSSDRETRLNNNLKEIRSAQASFETRNVDQRLLVTQSVNGGK